MTIFYLVSATEAQGIKDAAERGWERIAAHRFVTLSKDDVRLIWRYASLLPMAGQTPMIKGSDYESGPPPEDRMAWERWSGEGSGLGDKARFDAFVADGHGRWVEGT